MMRNRQSTYAISSLFQIKFLNPMITRRPKLRRQKKIFRQQAGKMPRPDQLNINVATWGRLLKRNLNFQKSLPSEGSSSVRSDSVSHSSTGTGKFACQSLAANFPPA